eukprot:scaffold3556_cov67-Attheya_sp.AAC.6
MARLSSRPQTSHTFNPQILMGRIRRGRGGPMPSNMRVPIACQSVASRRIWAPQDGGTSQIVQQTERQ